jgi:lipoprotein-anchoring transpeptidase ErfK/SrfK
VTDQATRPENAVEGELSTPAVRAPEAPTTAEPTWIAIERPPRKKHFGLWFGIPGGIVVAAAIAASLILIAPGVSVAGAQVGMSTQGMAEQTIATRLARAEIHVGDATLTGAELGASVDAKALARTTIGSHPLWNVTAWNPAPITGAVTIDPEVALPALRNADPSLFSDATNAQVVFDKKSDKFTVTAAKSGRGVDVKALAASLSRALTTSTGAVTVTPKQTEVEAAATTDEAQAFADKLNKQADTAGFYLQDQRAEPVPLATVASWIKISSDATTGAFTVTPDEAAIQKAIADLPDKVNQKAQNETVVTNSAGKQLRVIQAGHDGYGITSTDGLAQQIGASLKKSDLNFALQGQVVKYQTTSVFRRIEVDKSNGATYLYQGPKAGQEKLIATYPIAIGTGGTHETRDGHYTIYAQLAIQDMGDCDGKNYGFGYCTKNVPWVSYFDGDQGFHGTYWHNNFGPGARMSHGCVNMRIPDALALYKFAQIGTEVWVHE